MFSNTDQNLGGGREYLHHKKKYVKLDCDSTAAYKKAADVEFLVT